MFASLHLTLTPRQKKNPAVAPTQRRSSTNTPTSLFTFHTFGPKNQNLFPIVFLKTCRNVKRAFQTENRSASGHFISVSRDPQCANIQLRHPLNPHHMPKISLSSYQDMPMFLAILDSLHFLRFTSICYITIVENTEKDHLGSIKNHLHLLFLS